MSQNKFPTGWDEEKVQRVLAHYEGQIKSSTTIYTAGQAGQLLEVARQHVVDLLKAGTIPFHKAGSHRRIYASDLFRYKEERDKRRHAAILDFASLEQKQYLDS